MEPIGVGLDGQEAGRDFDVDGLFSQETWINVSIVTTLLTPQASVAIRAVFVQMSDYRYKYNCKWIIVVMMVVCRGEYLLINRMPFIFRALFLCTLFHQPIHPPSPY